MGAFSNCSKSAGLWRGLLRQTPTTGRIPPEFTTSIVFLFWAGALGYCITIASASRYYVGIVAFDNLCVLENIVRTIRFSRRKMTSASK